MWLSALRELNTSSGMRAWERVASYGSSGAQSNCPRTRAYGQVARPDKQEERQVALLRIETPKDLNALQ